MENLHDYYNYFNISLDANSNEILNAYRNKIIKFRNISNLDSDQINEIKILKYGLYILLNKKLRIKYNNLIGSLDNEPTAMNQEINDSLDNVFNIDNSWMNNNLIKNDKDKNDINMLGNRIFSLSNLQKKPGYSTENEIDLRIPLQGRIDKNMGKL
jgi:DnaJ-class molecular chaperone